jgi:hypothetical protein
MLRKLLISFFCLFLVGTSFGQLKVSANKRFLVSSDGTPFFWMGDTAWELFHRLSREEAEKYLRDRAAKKFNVIQAVALAELDGLHDPNPYGEIPLKNDDPTKPNEAYFQHVDYIINKANELGLYIALLPTWGDKITKAWGLGPEIFNVHNASIYGRWIGNRYKDKKNIIWVIGGDRNPDEKASAIWRAMAEGIAMGVGGHNKAIMTFHPQPNKLEDGGSSKYFHNDEWLDFNMFQTGHCRETNVWDRIRLVYNREPFKPVLDGEPLYEDHPICFNAKDLGTSSAYDVRMFAYLNVFAGAFGHTYGCHDVWQMYAPHRKPINAPHYPWYVAIDLPGASQMQYLRRLIESRPMLQRIPDQSLIVDARGNNDRIQATRGDDYAFIYSSQGKPITVNMGTISGSLVNCFWYSPKDGTSKPAGTVDNQGQHVFSPPSSGYGHDWVLVLDDASKSYSVPK